MSYYDLPPLVGSSDFPFYRAPLGVDDTYDRRHLPPPACVLTTGHKASGERSANAASAAAWVNQPMFHVWSHCDFMGDGCFVVNGVSDEPTHLLRSTCLPALVPSVRRARAGN